VPADGLSGRASVRDYRARSVIDLHCHVLAGIDDGPSTTEDSLTLARAAAAAGTRTIVATPHVSWRYPNDHETIARLVDDLNGRLGAAGIELDVVAGAELAMTRLIDIDDAQLPRFALGGSSWLLVEPPFTQEAPGIEGLVLELLARGHRVVLAHPERCPAFRRDPRMLERLVSRGVLTSITAGSLVGRFGNDVRRFAFELLAAEMVHNVASDAHASGRRGPLLAADLERAGLAALSEWLCVAVPSAILADDEAVPQRPQVAVPQPDAAPRRWWRGGAAGLRRASRSR
jgi:protein-tyrosine phosphatase